MNRWKNYGLWMSIAALVPLIAKAFNMDIVPANYNELVNSVASILVLAGILNNPTDGKGYADTPITTGPKDITNDIK